MCSNSARSLGHHSMTQRLGYRRRWLAWIFVIVVQSLAVAPLHAQNPSSVTGPLVTLIDTAPSGTFNQLEQLSATANQASYNQLTANPNGAVYCDPLLKGPSAKCPSNVFAVFSNLRELVQSANELLNNGGPTFYSLHTNNQGLGFALRWVSGNNLAAPGSVTTQFANAQLSSVAARIEALRLGATGFVLGGFNVSQDGRPAVAFNTPVAAGGGASADGSDIGIASRWGGFLNGAYGYGYRQPSVLENAFAFDSKDATLGVDYRFTRRLVAGASVSYTNQRVDFDSERSVAGGGFRAHGYGLLFYGLYEWEGPYLSFSAGWQHSSVDETRLITYPSFNLAVPSTDATASGSTHTNALIASFSAGWPLAYRAATAEPYLNIEYRDAKLAGFTETSVNNSGTEAGSDGGFQFAYASQDFHIADAALGLRLQYAFTPHFGVIIPYARAEYHRYFGANTYTVAAAYSPIAGSGNLFNLPTDPADTHYSAFGGGFSVVLPHGVQGFAQYQTTSGMQFVTSRLISAGIRVEF